jgi:phosphate transport system protein
VVAIGYLSKMRSQFAARAFAHQALPDRDHDDRTAMRATFNRQLDDLNETLSAMATFVGDAMQRASHAVEHADLAVAEDVVSSHDELRSLSARAEAQAFTLLARQAPVACDLRAIVAATHIIADIDRMGGLSVHIAEAARRRHPARVLPEEITPFLAEMGQVAVAMAHTVGEVLLTHDSAEARRLHDDDDVMDDLHRRLTVALTDSTWPYGVAAAVDVTLLGRFYERFADHAVLVGRRIVFQVTGQLPQPAV